MSEYKPKRAEFIDPERVRDVFLNIGSDLIEELAGYRNLRMSSKDVKTLFRPFSKSSEDASGSAPGIGLGLALSRRLARKMGGNLRLEKHTGQGAFFALYLIIFPSI